MHLTVPPSSSVYVIFVIVCFIFFHVLFIECNLNQHDNNFQYEDQIQPPYQQPSQEEFKSKLRELFNEADTDSDGLLDVKEMGEWITKANREIMQDSLERQWYYYEPHIQELHDWEDYNKEEKLVVIWEKYKNKTYSDEMFKDANQNVDDHLNHLKKMLARAQRRWENADRNNDTYLTKDEFKDFVHPEYSENENVKNVLILEALEDMDKNSNGIVSLEEYMNHVSSLAEEQERNDQEWIQIQQNHFSHYLDKNKDGILDKEELEEWIVPNYNKNEFEATRLIFIADENQDQKLSEFEMIKNLNEFMNLMPPSFWTKYMQDDVYDLGHKSHDEL